MGVAVMTRISGCSPFDCRTFRCSTPKRCCSSMTARPRRWKAMPRWMRACVPTAICTEPSASARRTAAVEPRRAHQLDAAAVAEQAPEIPEMLLGEELGRRHEGGLQAALGREQQADRRDDRLAAADVALQQAEHRLRALQVVDDLLHHPLLRSGEGERQHGARRRRATGRRCGSVPLLHCDLDRPPPGELELELQQLAVGQARVRAALAAVQTPRRRSLPPAGAAAAAPPAAAAAHSVSAAPAAGGRRPRAASSAGIACSSRRPKRPEGIPARRE